VRAYRYAVLIGMAFLTLQVLYFNRDLLSKPIIEFTDFAANALQVQEAKFGRELLGNYSRFHFNHPGPVFFYVMAAGEWIFYDLLRVTAAPFNAEILAVILLNSALWTAALLVLLRQFPSALFPPLAIVASIWFLYTTNVTSMQAAGLNGVMVSPWIPHLLLFAFILLVTAAASVASGVIDHLPFCALGAAMLVHGHVAQILFASIVFLVAVIALLAPVIRGRNLRFYFAQHKRKFALAAIILGVFASPILIEAAIHSPDNIDAIQAHLASRTGTQKNLSEAARYFASFLAHDPAPETTLAQANPPLFHIAFSRPYSRAFLLVLLVAAFCAFLLLLVRPRPSNRCAASLAGMLTLVSILFLVWSMKITGDFYQFNGFFIFSLQWIALVASLAIIAERIFPLAVFRAAALPALTAAAAAAIQLCPEQSLHHIAGEPRARAIAEAVARTQAPIRIETKDWATGLGVASWLKRRGVDFCVDPSWGYAYGELNVCRHLPEATLEVNGRSASCYATEPLFAQDGMMAVLRPSTAARPDSLDAGIADRLAVNTSIETINAQARGGGEYLLRSPDTNDVSLLQAQIPLRRATKYLIEFTARPLGEINKPLLVNLYSGSYVRQERILELLPQRKAWHAVVIDSGPETPGRAAVRIYTQSTVPVEIGGISVATIDRKLCIKASGDPLCCL
jgi:hypothetical protein